MKGTTVLQIITLAVCGALGYYAYMSSKEFERLHLENQILWEKMDSLQKTPAKNAPTQKKAAPAQSAAASLLDEIFSDMQKDYRKSRSEGASTKMTVETSYRIEDRYASYPSKPDIFPDTPGMVVIDFEITQIGKVKKTSVNPATTITDENVIDACRKAALKTDFNYISTAPESQNGTFTYSFVKK